MTDNASQYGNTILYAGCDGRTPTRACTMTAPDTTTRGWAGSSASDPMGYRRQRRQPLRLLRRQPDGRDGPERDDVDSQAKWWVPYSDSICLLRLVRQIRLRR